MHDFSTRREISALLTAENAAVADSVAIAARWEPDQD
jgi:hypothetical protein